MELQTILLYDWNKKAIWGTWGNSGENWAYQDPCWPLASGQLGVLRNVEAITVSIHMNLYVSDTNIVLQISYPI